MLIELSVNGVAGKFLETNKDGFIVISSISFPTIPYQASLKVGISKDVQFEDNYVTTSFINQSIELHLKPKQNPKTEAIIAVHDSVFFSPVDDVTVWLGD